MVEEKQSIWREAMSPSRWGPLNGDKEYDVVIVGAGIAGMTAAHGLARAGRKVAIIEMHDIGAGETGNTTAHLTELLDTPYRQLKKDFGAAGARLAAQSSRAAIEHIANTSERYDIRCEFTRLPGYLYSEDGRDLAELKEEAAVALECGIEAGMEAQIPLPFKVKGGLRFGNQAQFHPLEYLSGLADKLRDWGVEIFTHTRAVDFEDGEPAKVHTDLGTLSGKAVFVAAHCPISNRFFLHTKLAAYRTYVIAAEVPRQGALSGLFWDTEEPYHYIRSRKLSNGSSALIIGGEDHKTGTKAFTQKCYERLQRYAKLRFGVEAPTYAWSGQILEPVDGLPYIGRNSLSTNIYVATGFSGNGMTFGTVAGLLVADEILGLKNSWASLYAATRVKPLASAVDYVHENKDFPLHLIRDRLSVAESNSLADVTRGTGKVVQLGSEKVAVYKKDNGDLVTLSPVCPHLGCLVHFNGAEKTWDCPCHGSRFSGEGKVLNGPAVSDLRPQAVSEGEKPTKRSA